MDESGEKFHKLLNKHVLPLVLGVAGLLFFGYGLLSLGGQKQDKPDILFEAASDVNPTAIAAQKEVKQIAVDVEGAVLKPGVYTLKTDSRVHDALVAAGGMSEEADRAKVAKSLNLASKITDGAKIYIPFLGEAIVEASETEETAVMGDSTSDLININSASASELESLPGIGEVTAGKIIDSRPYASIEELLEKKIVGKSVFEKIKDKVGL